MRYACQELITFQFDDYNLTYCSSEAERLDSGKLQLYREVFM
jgi:hypothetical protein